MKLEKYLLLIISLSLVYIVSMTLSTKLGMIIGVAISTYTFSIVLLSEQNKLKFWYLLAALLLFFLLSSGGVIWLCSTFTTISCAGNKLFMGAFPSFVLLGWLAYLSLMWGFGMLAKLVKPDK